MDTFLGGIPRTEYKAFLALVLGLAALNLFFWFRYLFDRCGHALAGWIRRRGLFTITDPARGQFRIDCFRIALGGVAAYRCLANLLPTMGTAPPELLIPQAVSLVLTLAVLVGFCTPVAALLLVVCQNLWFVPLIYKIGNLPSTTMLVALMPMVLVPAGRRLSVDGLLMRGDHLAARLLRSLYGIWGPFNPDRYTLALFGSLLGYSALCISSFVNHVQDPGWQSGLINATLFLWLRTNNVFHPLFERFYEVWPWGYVNFARLSTYLTLAWEVLLLPFAFSSRTRWLVVGYGLLFFVVSLLVLGLTYLALVEMVLWGLLFWQRWPFASAAPEPEVPAPTPSPAGPSLGVVYRVWALSYSFLFVVHVAFWDGMDTYEWAKETRKSFAKRAGRLHELYGLVPMLVFDTRAEEFPYCVYFDLKNTDIHDPVEMERYRSYQWLCAHRGGTTLLDLKGRPADLKQLMKIFRVRPNPDRDFIQLDIRLFKTAKDTDFANYRFVRPRDELVCRCRFDPATGEVVGVSYAPEGVGLVFERANVDLPVNKEAGHLLTAYPAYREAARLWRWVDSAAPGSCPAEARTQLAALLTAIPRARHPAHHLLALERLNTSLGLDWDRQRSTRPGPWAADLDLAGHYYRSVFDSSLREQTGELLHAAEQAAERGDHDTVLRMTARLRRAYYTRLLQQEVRPVVREDRP